MAKLEAADKIRRWQRFELYECFLVFHVVTVYSCGVIVFVCLSAA